MSGLSFSRADLRAGKNLFKIAGKSCPRERRLHHRPVRRGGDRHRYSLLFERFQICRNARLRQNLILVCRKHNRVHVRHNRIGGSGKLYFSFTYTAPSRMLMGKAHLRALLPARFPGSANTARRREPTPAWSLTACRPYQKLHPSFLIPRHFLCQSAQTPRRRLNMLLCKMALITATLHRPFPRSCRRFSSLMPPIAMTGIFTVSQMARIVSASMCPASGFGTGRKRSADAQIIRTMTFCAERFFHIMRGYADDFVSAQNGTHIAGFHIILPDMHPGRVNLFPQAPRRR